MKIFFIFMLLLHYTMSTEESSKNTFWTKRSKDVLTTIKDFKENQRILQILTGNMLKGKLKIRSNTSLQRKKNINKHVHSEEDKEKIFTNY